MKGLEVVLVLVFYSWITKSSLQSRMICKVKCGVIADDARVGVPSTLDEVRSAWTELRFHKNIMDVDIQFVSIANRDDLGMDALIEAYMEIGTINMTAMIGPYVEPLATVTEKFGIPYFVISPLDKVRYRPYNLLYVLPRPLDVMLVAADVARKYLWKELAVIYDTEEGIHLMGKLVEYPSLHVHSWQLSSDTQRPAIRDILVTIRQLGISNIILMTSEGNKADMVLSEALHLSLLSHHYSWILPNMNLNLDQLAAYAQTEMNLTSFRLAENFVPDLQVPAHSNRLEYITLFDSLLTIYHGVRSYYYQKGSCHWLGEDAIYSSIQRIKDLGATGRISFEDTGRRTGYVVNVYGLGDGGLHEMGTWNSSTENVSQRLNLTVIRRRPAGSKHALGTGKVRVAAALAHPFIHYHKDYKQREGNDRFEGFCVDLLDSVSHKIGFEYEIYTVPDGQTGQRYPNGSWTGVIGELVKGNVGLGIGALAITSTREGVVDFTEPFASVSVSVVMRRTGGPVFTLFQLFRPLSPIVWVLIVGVLVFISTALCVIDRVASSRDNNQAHPLSAFESFWITFASMVLKAVDNTPKSISTRILLGSVWCFALIIIVSYSANLAAFFTTSRIDTTVRSIEDLVGQTRVQFGTLRNSHISKFFRSSRLPNLQRMWHAMSAGNSSWMVNSASEGFRRVRDPHNQYAFLWDHSEVRQYLHQDCDLVEVDQVSRVLDYAIAVPEGVHYKDDISLAVLKLKESGELQEFENRWWPERECSKHNDVITAPSSLSIEDMAPVFIILGVGVVLALVASVLEHVYRSKRRKGSKNRKIPEDGFSTKPLCDGNVPGTTQLDEPFLYQSNYATHNSKANHNSKGSKHKQTNIF